MAVASHFFNPVDWSGTMQRLFPCLAVVILSLLVFSADLNAENAADYVIRGNASFQKGEFDKAIADYTEAIRLDPNDVPYCNRGNAWASKGEHDKAIADFDEAIRINPKDAGAYFKRGYAWDRKGECEKAIADYDEAIRLDPRSAPAYIARGMVWVRKGEYDKAITDLNQVLSINPKDVTAYNGLAWIQATCPDEKYRDGKKAVENANRAYDLTEGKVSRSLTRWR